ncbi:sugar ABC transporter ATP-binding protein [Caproiciproducens sp. CPB-2]|uniref:sugar ABC transporter ATP-binding protein n=1 Tax=Caproiciproducens sp. CPB-2 TaxID=3030017 RepID=UPI0023D9EC20|nr:sugar ABC transporter ATP-binding protein [Caproiciproducens sp. CPB-2]MDF1493497.1 sugar ABC transporter ATP-binding protein [Caproiciproducens sp. CPB-2]
MSSENMLIRMEHISKSFPGVAALDDVPLELKSGEIHALLGENGAGKSTLIKVLTGVEERDGGSVLLEGVPIFPQSPQDAQKLGISTVYQEVNLCPNLSVAENIYIGREPKKRGSIDWKKINQDSGDLLKRFNLTIDVTKNLDFYSVAVQQMVAIARAVDISAKVLILDEPTSSLSSVEVEKLFEVMNMLKAQGMGILFVTHFLDQVYAVADTITVLRNGRYVGTYAAAELHKTQLVGKMLGKEYAELDLSSEKEELTGGELSLLEMKRACGPGTVSGVDLKIYKGEVLGISGLLGSGRSEIVRLIFGIDPLEQGEISLNGRKLAGKGPLPAIRRGVAFCPENRKTEGIIGDLSIRENIILALQAKKGMLRAISRAQAERVADKYIKLLDIKTPSQEQRAKNLSGGNQQKVILARWLATDPQLLMLDEPTRGIDVGTKAEIQKMIVGLAEQGMTVVFISSEIDEMLRCCSRMIVLRDKKKVGELSGKDIAESAVMSLIAGGVKNGEDQEAV